MTEMSVFCVDIFLSVANFNWVGRCKWASVKLQLNSSKVDYD